MPTVCAPADLLPLDLPESVRLTGDPSDSSINFYIPTYMGSSSELDTLSELRHLEVVQLLTAGFDHALPHIPAGVRLCNAVGVHDASTAELAVGVILTSLRGLDDFARAMPSGAWLHHTRTSLADRTVLIVGAGGVGAAIAKRLEGFECSLTLVGRTARPGVHGIGELPELLGGADIVVMAVPLTSQTRGLVDDSFLAAMREGALLVNVSRGPIVITDDLLAHLLSGRITAALDVTDPEPLPPEHPLWTTPGVFISPHVGGNTTAFLPRARALVSENIRRWVVGEGLLGEISTR